MEVDDHLSPEEIQGNVDIQNFKTDTVSKVTTALWTISDMRENWELHLSTSNTSKRKNAHLTVDVNGKPVKLNFNLFYLSPRDDGEDRPHPNNSSEECVFSFKPSSVPKGVTALTGKLLVEILNKDGNVWKTLNAGPIDWLNPEEYQPGPFESIYRTHFTLPRRRLLSERILGDSDTLKIRITFTHLISRTLDYPNAAVLHEKATTSTNNILAQQMEALLNDPDHADVNLKINDGFPIKAHKLILSTRSSVFKTMFEAGFIERSGYVEIPDISSATMNILLYYIYTAVVHPDWKKNISELLNGANKYDLPGLIEYCNVMLITLCNEVNAEDLLEIAKLYSLGQAIKDIENFMKGMLMQ